jgi:hypothetical protein
MPHYVSGMDETQTLALQGPRFGALRRGFFCLFLDVVDMTTT